MHYYRGIAFEQLFEQDPRGAEVNAKAEQSFREAIRRNPSFADAYYHLSKLYARSNPKLAEENLRTCLRLDPHHVSAEYSLGRLYLRTGRRAEGLALLELFERHQQAEKLKEQQKPRLQVAHG
jgi:cytochrome c-type biogenesis protein CcmH/NrfG